MQRKIFIISFLTLSAIFAWFVLIMKQPPAPNVLTAPVCTHCKVVFISKGTLSPPNQLITTISIYRDSTDTFQSEYQFQEGSRVTGQEKKAIDKAVFDTLISDALKANPNANYGALPNCTGGSTYNLLVYDDSRVILNTGNYRCEGKGTNPSMDRLANGMLNLFIHKE
ncbi:MAG: hypothetical protein NT098_05460 [Candidatus Parcubacteria bacterium]|nr:hypothetical protein [Candidatus Parcubacteria bacterium]